MSVQTPTSFWQPKSTKYTWRYVVATLIATLLITSVFTSLFALPTLPRNVALITFAVTKLMVKRIDFPSTLLFWVFAVPMPILNIQAGQQNPHYGEFLFQFTLWLVITHIVVYRLLIPFIMRLWESEMNKKKTSPSSKFKGIDLSRPGSWDRDSSPAPSPSFDDSPTRVLTPTPGIEHLGNATHYPPSRSASSHLAQTFGSAGECGAVGEERTVQMFKEFFSSAPGEAVMLSSLSFPGVSGARTRGDIDHAVVIGDGVYLIDSKYYGKGAYSLSSEGDIVKAKDDGSTHTVPSNMGVAYDNVQKLMPNAHVRGAFIAVHRNDLTNPAKFSVSPQSVGAVSIADPYTVLQKIDSDARQHGFYGQSPNAQAVSILEGYRL